MKKTKKDHFLFWFNRIGTFFTLAATIVGILLLFLMPFYPILTRLIPTIGGLAISFLFVYLNKRFSSQKAIKKMTIVSIISILLGAVVFGADYYYFRVIKSIDDMQADKEYHVSYLVVNAASDYAKLDDLAGKDISFLTDDSLLVNTAIKNEFKNKSFTNYNELHYPTYVAEYEALIDGTIDAMVIDVSGIATIKEVYEDYSSNVKVVLTVQTEMDTESGRKDVNIASEPFTILINGVDIRSGNLNEGANADVIMLATFNPKTMKMQLTSIPRDTFVHVPCRSAVKDKITHSGSGGVNCTEQAIEEMFDIEINYYVKVNFFAVVDIVDELGGVTVNVPKAFCEQDSKDKPNAICLEAGEQTLNGEQALAFSRHRKTLPQGDIGRGANQQRVIEAIISKLASGKVISSFDRLLSVASKNIQTNLTRSDMYGFYQLILDIGAKSVFSSTSALQISSMTVSGHGANLYTEWLGDYLYYYIPYKESIEEISKSMKQVLGIIDYDLPSPSFAFNANKPYVPEPSKTDETGTSTLDPTDYIDPVKLPDFSGYSLSKIKTWCEQNADAVSGVSLQCTFVDSTGNPISNSNASFVSLQYSYTPYSRTKVLAKPYITASKNTLTFVMTGGSSENPGNTDSDTISISGRSVSNAVVYSSTPSDVNAEVKRILGIKIMKGNTDVTNDFKVTVTGAESIDWTKSGINNVIKITTTDENNNSISRTFSIKFVENNDVPDPTDSDTNEDE